MTKDEGKLCPHRFRADRVSRLRRAIFAYVTTLVCLGGTLAIVVIGLESTLATRVAEALMSYAELMAILYLGASVIDRQQIIRRVGRHWRRQRGRPVEVQSPHNMMDES